MQRPYCTARLLAAASTLLAIVAVQQPAAAQDYFPNPALSLSRSANTANGGIDSEWEYHRRANLPDYRPTITPISKFAGGSGYCTPPCSAPYYGCDLGRSCRRSSSCSMGCSRCGGR